ncbi:hypothetical protein DAPPUDRAFT_234294 [Daphnia pulex]|uniref:Uncharacterized protein n=1 Tax=Daphnia pulex TaxID=6669 RepID=E9FY22_DAPPU|nr:hypothetical protein DAPPUDRAFT_234294 [Daphnia pulex]|eukprot:EFX88469.1 hypothetical protein DAPPUDRAFT_234294 [Daphnia pulex]
MLQITLPRVTSPKPEYYITEALQLRRRIYYTEEPKYYSAPSYYQTEAPVYYTRCRAAVGFIILGGWGDHWCTDVSWVLRRLNHNAGVLLHNNIRNTYVAPAYTTKGTEYYTTKRAEYYTTAYAAPAFNTDHILRYNPRCPHLLYRGSQVLHHQGSRVLHHNYASAICYMEVPK